MGYPGFPVLGTVPVVPLSVTVRAEGGAGDLEHRFAKSFSRYSLMCRGDDGRRAGDRGGLWMAVRSS